jgi:hypothetical protein
MQPTLQRRLCVVRPSLILVTASLCALAAMAAFPEFPQGPFFDKFQSRGVFKVTLSPALGGQSFVISVMDPDTVVFRSASLMDGGAPGDTSGPLGEATGFCPGGATPGTTSAQIGFHPAGFELGGVEEVHTEMACLNMTGGGWAVRAGRKAPIRPRSLGEVESRAGDNLGFPADSFFNLFLEVQAPAGPPFGGRVLFNRVPILVQERIGAFPPNAANYLHSFTVAGRVALFFDDQGVEKFAGWLSQGTHNVNGASACLKRGTSEFPVLFSVDGPANAAEGLFQPDPLFPFGHPVPNDVFAVGPAGPHGYQTEGELFQSSGFALGGVPDATNVDRLSAALAIGPAVGGPYHGPFRPNVGGAAPAPGVPGGAMGTLGIKKGDNVDALSFGRDAGNVLVFGVSPTSLGLAGVGVNFQAVVSAKARAIGAKVPTNGGGDPGHEAAGDLFVSPRLAAFGAGNELRGLVPVPLGTNGLIVDEFDLGLQAPATRHHKPLVGTAEDDLDAVELSNAALVDDNVDGIPGDAPGGVYGPLFFSLHKQANSPSLIPVDPHQGCATANDLDGVTADDILVSPPPPACQPQAPFDFAIYARGVADIGLLANDDLRDIALIDRNLVTNAPDGKLTPNRDAVLFSLAAGSPSLAAGANPNFPMGAHSAADVFQKVFGVAGVALYASAANLGLRNADELDTLDIGWGGCQCAAAPGCACDECGNDDDLDGICAVDDDCSNTYDPDQNDCDGDGVGDLCDNCPTDYNPDQRDSDHDIIGDVCDPDGPGGPANDLCANAIQVGNGSTFFSTAGAATNGPAHAACDSGGDAQVNKDVFYRYNATCNGTVTVSLCGSGYATKLAVYNGTACALSDGTLNQCNFDACSMVSFTATQGTGYTIRAGGRGAASGDGILTISCTAAHPTCVAATPTSSELPCTYPDLNSGCTQATGQTEAIACGQTVAGWGGNVGVLPDVDEYQFVLPSPMQVTLSVTAEFDASISIIGDACPPAVVATTSGSACQVVNLTACLEGGMAYRVVVTPLSTSPPVACDAFYTASLSCGACGVPVNGACPGTGSCLVGQNNSPGCADAACCDVVCAFDPFCCDVTWDALCGQEAVDACNCSDANVCTDDFVNLPTGCAHANNTVPCDDGVACTINDTCGGGACSGVPGNGVAGTINVSKPAIIGAEPDSRAMVTWPASTSIDMIRGDLFLLRSSSGVTNVQVCLANDLSVQPINDNGAIGTGAVYFLGRMSPPGCAVVGSYLEGVSSERSGAGFNRDGDIAADPDACP